MQVLPLVLGLCAASVLFAQEAPAPAPPAAKAPMADTRTGFLTETLETTSGNRAYVLFVPPGYRQDRRWPLIVFLHGAGECGTDGWKQVAVGLGQAIQRDVAAWPFLVLFPQKPDQKSAWEDHEEMVLAMLAKTRTERVVDDQRVFLTGLSQGGHGTWVLGARHPRLWTAIAPICGYGDPAAIAPSLRTMPIWAFHGEDDKAVPVKQSKDLVAALGDTGGRAELTLYPRTGHNAWDKAYQETALAEWLLATASDPVYARYLPHLEQVTRASIEIQNVWTTDGGWAHRGTTTAFVQLDRDGLQWRWTTNYQGAAVADPEPHKGKLERGPGRERILKLLGELQQGGIFRLPETIEPAPVQGAVMATDQLTVDVMLDGKPGLWSFHRVIPALAGIDERYRVACGCLVETLRSVEAMR